MGIVRVLANPFALALLALVVLTGFWVAFAHQEMVVHYLWLLAMLAGVLYFAPTGYRRGHPNQGAAAALMTVVLGPVALLVLVPWAKYGR
jgi:hypothetical protein